MPVHHFDPKDIGEQTMYWWEHPSGPTLTRDPVSLIPIQRELTELRKAFARQQTFLLLSTCGLAAMAFIATGLSLYLYLLNSG